jgi:hypothetical protein
MFGRRRLRGTALLDSVVAQFDQMVTDLLAASAQINGDVQMKESQISVLQEQKATLINAEARAHRVREKLESLVE